MLFLFYIVHFRKKKVYFLKRIREKQFRHLVLRGKPLKYSLPRLRSNLGYSFIPWGGFCILCYTWLELDGISSGKYASVVGISTKLYWILREVDLDKMCAHPFSQGSNKRRALRNLNSLLSSFLQGTVVAFTIVG